MQRVTCRPNVFFVLQASLFFMNVTCRNDAESNKDVLQFIARIRFVPRMERSTPACLHLLNRLADQPHANNMFTVIWITRENATSSTVVTNNKKPSVLRRDMVNHIPPLPDDEKDFEFANTEAQHSLPCHDEDAIFDNESDCLDVPTFAFRPPQCKKVPFCPVVDSCTLLNKTGPSHCWNYWVSVFVEFSSVVLLTLIDSNNFQYILTVAQASSIQNARVDNFCR